MLRQAGVFRANQQVDERVLDSNPLERERGITILSKNTAVRWGPGGDTKINIVDTPGHADFGGEVERILRMVDGFLLLVDAAEGPMPQTRFVAGKALALGLKPIVLVNKVDRQDADPLRVHDEVLELFLELEATPEQFSCPFLYTSSRYGTATRDLALPGTTLVPLFETILETIPAPRVDREGPFQMLISTLDYSSYLGRIGIGRIERGRVRLGDTVALLPLGEPGPLGDAPYEQARVVKLFGFEGLERVALEEAAAGEIVAVAGLAGVEIGKTVTAPDHLERLAGIAVEEPTISVDVKVNDSPFAGREGKYVTGRQLRDRLFRELERNVALRVEETADPQTFTVSGRGELHLGVLMETMRREGYEFQVSRPRIIPREGPNGEQLEPYEELMIDGPEGCLGVVMEKLGPRRATLLDMRNPGVGTVRMRFKIPARGLLGYRSEFLTDTRGTGIMHHRFLDYGPWAGRLEGGSRGACGCGGSRGGGRTAAHSRVERRGRRRNCSSDRDLLVRNLQPQPQVGVTMLSRDTSGWSLKRRSDSLGDEEFEDFEEDKDLDEDFDEDLDEDELEDEDLDDLDEYDDLYDEFDDEEESGRAHV